MLIEISGIIKKYLKKTKNTFKLLVLSIYLHKKNYNYLKF